MNSVQESDYHTEESKKTFNQESFKRDENEMLNQDEKLKQEAVKLFKFSELTSSLNIMEKSFKRKQQILRAVNS